MVTDEILSEFEIVAHRGAEAGGSALTTLLGAHVTVLVNDVDRVSIEKIPEIVFDSEVECIGLVSRVLGDIKGNSILLFSEEDAVLLVEALGSGVKCQADFGELECSMLEETANITISSFMNSMTFHLRHSCIPNAPSYQQDISGAILSLLLMESAYEADKVIMFSTRFFCKSQDIKASFIFLPSPPSLRLIEEGLG